jgi:probable rRNA maturation factor
VCCSSENHQIDTLYYNFLDDKALLDLNQQFLKHNTLTDIITFDYTQNKIIQGEVYISVDRIKENSLTFKVSPRQELLRILVHGLLHLCGYSDKTPADKKIMTSKEDFYLNMFHVKHTH